MDVAEPIPDPLDFSGTFDIVFLLTEILEKHLEGNYLVSSEDKAKMISDILILFNFSVDIELQRLFNWLQDPIREPAQTKFTAGMTRNVAREFEYLLKQQQERIH